MEQYHGSIKTAVIGFFWSIVLTFAAYLLVVEEWLHGPVLVIALISLAIFQLLVQLFFFLHMGHEQKPRWNLIVFLFMALVLLIIVAGSLWIMYNLDYTLMPHDMMH